MPPIPTTMRRLLDDHDGLLLDAYGVLVDVSGPLPGAVELIELLEATAKPYAICSNDASRLPATYAARFARADLNIPAARIASAGMLLAGYFSRHAMEGARCAVLGTPDALAFVTAAGGEPVPLRQGMEIDALVVCDDEGFDFREALDLTLSAAVRAVSAGRPLQLVLPNPDILYPKCAGEFGFTAGGMACMIEAGLARRFPGLGLTFTRLGKPGAELLHFAHRQILGGLRADRLVMVGDQVETDIAAATAAGMASALVDGISQWSHVQDPLHARAAQPAATSSGAWRPAAEPTYLLSSVTP